MDYSIIVPLYNEEKNVKLLNKELVHSIIELKKAKKNEFQLIFVDDASEDNTFDELKKFSTNPIETLIIKHRINLSQSAALNTGISYSKYENLIILDGDLQNDPADLKKMVTEYEKGTDMLIGWRKIRKDNFFLKTLPSLTANYLIRIFSKSKIHDHGCAFKIVKKSSIDELTNWGDFHRLLAARLANNGYKITEIEINHNKRIHGKSNYGFSRIFKVIIDLFYLNFFKNSKTQAIYFFGMFSFFSIFCSLVVFCVMLYLKYALDRSFILTPLPLMVIFFLISGIIFLFIGILAQLIISQQNNNLKRQNIIEKEIYIKRN